MTVPIWLHADPLASVLLRRGYPSSEAFAISERAAFLQYDAGLSELDAIAGALGWVPHQIREHLEPKASA